MNEEEIKKLKELLEIMKRTTEFQTVNSKKAKATAEATPSTVQQTVSAVKVQQTTPVQTGKILAQQAKSLQGKGKLIAPIEQKRTFATATVRDWYNKELLDHDPEFYEKLNGCCRAIQSADMRSSNYWLTQIEKHYICLKQANIKRETKAKEGKELLAKLIEFSSTSKSHALELREAQLMSNESTEKKSIKEVFMELETSDLVNLRIQDFLDLTNFFEIKSDKTRELEAEMTVHNMINLYQQNLIDEERFLLFFKRLEDTDISSLFENEEIILNENKRPRLVACFQEVQKYKPHIRKGIVHEVYINTSHPEEFEGCLPDICKQKVMEYSSRFQTIFMFKIWSIWEERQYIKLYPSVQLWILHRITDNPDLQFVKFQKKDFLEDKERRLAAKEFFDKAGRIAQYTSHTVYEGKTVLFLDTLNFHPGTKKTNNVKEFLETIHLGRTGSMAQEDFLTDEELRLAQENENDGGHSTDSEMLANLEIGD
jgi:hypothetical protein